MTRLNNNSQAALKWGLGAALLLFLVRVVLGLIFSRLLLAPLSLTDYLSLQILDSLLVITLVLLFLRKYRVKLRFILNPLHLPWTELATTGILTGIGLLLVGNWGEAWVKANLLAELGPHPLYQLTANADRLGQFALPFIVGAFLVPLAEELFYRGILYPPLLGRLGALGAIIAGAALFTMTHYNQYWTLEIFIVGLVLTYLFHRFRSIIPGLLAHIIINGGRLVMIYLAV